MGINSGFKGLKALTVLLGRVTHEHHHPIGVGVVWAGGSDGPPCAGLFSLLRGGKNTAHLLEDILGVEE